MFRNEGASAGCVLVTAASDNRREADKRIEVGATFRWWNVCLPTPRPFVTINAMTIEFPANFYLGKKVDLSNHSLLDEPLNYNARDLTTHAVIIGMTGSGKTGLGITFLEEAALDSIPALIIDPKGDLTNLLLTFPQLRPDDFLPWVEEIPADAFDAAPNAGESVSRVSEAARLAAQWKDGLAQWGIEATRIQRLRETADFTIFTPGSEAGVPLNILDALRVPALAWSADAENLRDKIQGIVSAILGLTGSEADPLRSREHILLSHLIEHAWRAGKDMDVEQLILGIQDPPMRKLGVFELDTFFPPKDRFELAMSLNAILAAPSFESWLHGEPFEVETFFKSPHGKPRHAIFYIAHLNDSERLFFVSLLLQQVRSWMRMQAGTGRLRALLYFDEMFGYLPPYPRNPATKAPLLSLLKTARAYGLGLVLATQNPIDLDYKALTNAGTWFIGKLQTQFDKGRLLDGLQTVANESGVALDREQLNDAIGALTPRVFLYHNIHQPPPIGFHSRWTMSYLKGPLTKTQIRQLVVSSEGRTVSASHSQLTVAPPHTLVAMAQSATSAAPTPYLVDATNKRTRATRKTQTLAVLSPDIAQYYLELPTSNLPLPNPNDASAQLVESTTQPTDQAINEPSDQLTYQPHILGMATVTFDDRKTGTRHALTYTRLLTPTDHPRALDWATSEALTLERSALQTTPSQTAPYAELPAGLGNPKTIAALEKAFAQYLYREAALVLRKNSTLKVVEAPDESERVFRQRCAEAARIGLETEQQKIKAKYGKQVDKLAERLQKLQSALSAEKKELEGRKSEQLWTNLESFAALLGFGHVYRPISTATRRRRETKQSETRIEDTAETIEQLQQKLTELQKEMDAELQATREKWIAAQDHIEEFKVMPRKSDIHIEAFGIAWRLM